MAHVRVKKKGMMNLGLGAYSSTKSMDKASRLHKKLSDYEEFCTAVLPALRKDLKDGLTDKEILEKYKNLAAARLVTLAADIQNPGTSLAASKEVLDRASGKATEKRIVEHRMAGLSDHELDAVLVTEYNDMKQIEPPKK